MPWKCLKAWKYASIPPFILKFGTGWRLRVGRFTSGPLHPPPLGWTPEPVVSLQAVGNILQKLHNPFWGPINTFCNEYKRRPFFRCEVSRGMKLTTYLHLAPRLKTSGAVPPLSHIPSWCSQLYYNQKQEYWQSCLHCTKLFLCLSVISLNLLFYWGADKSLARPGMKQATATKL